MELKINIVEKLVKLALDLQEMLQNWLIIIEKQTNLGEASLRSLTVGMSVLATINTIS